MAFIFVICFNCHNPILSLQPAHTSLPWRTASVNFPGLRELPGISSGASLTQNHAPISSWSLFIGTLIIYLMWKLIFEFAAVLSLVSEGRSQFQHSELCMEWPKNTFKLVFTFPPRLGPNGKTKLRDYYFLRMAPSINSSAILVVSYTCLILGKTEHCCGILEARGSPDTPGLGGHHARLPCHPFSVPEHQGGTREGQR